LAKVQLVGGTVLRWFAQHVERGEGVASELLAVAACPE
jgi:hypothetical protein